jgi:Alpha 1,4-glycosyltransferase conserved region
MDQPIIQSLWIGPLDATRGGPRLSVMEQLAIRSFLHHGHPFHLYTYGPVDQIPPGTTVRPAAEILPSSEITCYEAEGYGRGNVSAFANEFRYKLLLDRGGWWTDLDSVCLRPLDFRDEHVLGYEREPDGRRHVATGLIKAPAGSSLIEYCWERCRQADRSRLVWGVTGPRLMAEALERVPVPVRILEPAAFYPIDSWRVWQLIRERQMPERSYAIHLWNSKWRRERLDPDSVYDLECIYEQLKRRFGVASPAGASYGPGWLSLAKVRIRDFKAGLRRRQPMLRAA